MSLMLDAALDYHAKGLHPVPCKPRDKRPLVRWELYQEEQPSREQVEQWWGDWPDANIALIQGRGICVVDLDGPQAEQLLFNAGIVLPDDAPRVRTGNGQHVYLRTPPGLVARNRAGLLSSVDGPKSQVDLRGFGGYVIAPPSIHPNGKRYEWLVGLPPVDDIPFVPGVLLTWNMQKPRPEGRVGNEPGWVAQALRGVPEGVRDDTAARLAGYLLAKGLPDDVVLGVLEGFAEKCEPPLPLQDLRRIVASIARAEARSAKDDPDAPVKRRATVEHISDSMARALEEIQSPRRGIATPFPWLNKLVVGGFQAGELIYFGARPGLGKTAMALEITRTAAKAGQVVLVVSREMLAASLSRRMISQEGRISATAMKLGQGDMPSISRVAENLSGLPIWTTDSARTLAEVRELIDEMPRKPGLLIVDYLQLIQAPREVRDRRLQVEFVSKGLKDLALELAIPVICLSSLSRPQSGTNPAPGLSSLRESGELEHDADIVIFLHREDPADPKTLCTVAKNRDGVTGDVPLYFTAEFLSFAEIDARYETQGWRR